ncbi:uncharacterized protein LOC122063523 isoform X1 [Macadamia integrifolia]|uniref:uncharacterized protein LOC122063523 isoform X1 n=1 Tax=Macadamia integrifolia TaxID=60698 RepID=UPI001C4EA31B|nr:uncharacterized protein LOC122063523 isoform X1 [Macadamia integrifolia]XP_042483153.1 uncharacterized protein LOC122063523 isoform X1 [Macadamia integrifolia]XP_042483155.1 uncharacterized protein LOC122063523 isoform X1 [Macadamia integrifolia]XP_042483156.1 uncharacterized protein LOC122063523 isoform X1 [Macadamia integrifolia]
MAASRGKLLMEVNTIQPQVPQSSVPKRVPFGPFHIMPNEDRICKELSSKVNFPWILLMNMADDVKKERLTKMIDDLDGVVTSDGSVSTHIITGKVRRTRNLCIALCSGRKRKGEPVKILAPRNLTWITIR